jgi:Putative zincin peptidase
MWRYYFYDLVTAPGVAIHELGHAFFCWLGKVKIYKIKLFQLGEVAGYVQHEEPQKFYQHIFVSFGPLIANTLVAMVLFAGIKRPFFEYHNALYLWFAIGLHAIPSTGDANALWGAARRRFWRNPFVFISFPLIVLLYFLNVLKRWRIHFLYTAALLIVAVVFLKK